MVDLVIRLWVIWLVYSLWRSYRQSLDAAAEPIVASDVI